MLEHEEQVKATVLAELNARNLREFWIERSSQFLDVGAGVFVELVVSDGSKLPKFEEVIAATKNEFQGLEIDSVVRAVWFVKSVRHIGIASSSDSPRAADAFEAILQSGTRTTTVQVDITWDAFEHLKTALQSEGRRDTGQELVELGADKVKQFLALQLSLGGTSYWDPVRYRHREINEPTMAYIMRRSAAYRQLESAVNYTLDQSEDNPLLPDFLMSLSNSSLSIHNAREALQLLPPEAFGGAYANGEDFETSASGAYQKLSRDEKFLIEGHFKSRVEELLKTLPEIVSTFPEPFRN